AREILVAEKVAIPLQGRKYAVGQQTAKHIAEVRRRVASGGIVERRISERRSEQCLELAKRDTNVAPWCAVSEAEALALIRRLRGRVGGDRPPPVDGRPPPRLPVATPRAR